MQLNCSGISFKIDDMKAGLSSVKNLSSIDIFKIESYIDMANMYGSDDTSIEQGEELTKLKNLINRNFKEKAASILNALGLNVSEETAPEKEQKTDTNNNNSVKQTKTTLQKEELQPISKKLADEIAENYISLLKKNKEDSTISNIEKARRKEDFVKQGSVQSNLLKAHGTPGLGKTGRTVTDNYIICLAAKQDYNRQWYWSITRVIPKSSI